MTASRRERTRRGQSSTACMSLAKWIDDRDPPEQMSRPIRKIAVNTGGGDAPGLNAVLRAIALGAAERGIEVWGIRHGYRGLLEGGGEGLMRLDRRAVRGIMHVGGTSLGTANRGEPFHYPVERDGTLIPAANNGELKALLQTGLKIFKGHEEHAVHLAAELK